MFATKFKVLSRIGKLSRYAIMVALVMVVFPTIALAGPPSPLDPVSPAARSITNLHNIILVIAIIVFSVVCGLLIYALVKFRRHSEDDPEPDQSFHSSATLETIWTIIPVAILAILLFLTLQTIQKINPDRPPDLTVEVTGKQWLWEIEYPEHNINLVGEMWVPVNTDIKIKVTSEDVIHSYWVPQLGGKTDAIPGYLQTTWFKADRLGTFRGQCAELCGLNHSNMPLIVNVVDQESFNIWLASKPNAQANITSDKTAITASISN